MMSWWRDAFPFIFSKTTYKQTKISCDKQYKWKYTTKNLLRGDSEVFDDYDEDDSNIKYVNPCN